jgi:hypothetical protein
VAEKRKEKKRKEKKRKEKKRKEKRGSSHAGEECGAKVRRRGLLGMTSFEQRLGLRDRAGHKAARRESAATALRMTGWAG